MNTLKQIAEENGKGIHSMFNACMHKAECCSKDDEIADLRSANAELKRQLGEWRNQAHQSHSAFKRSGKQLAESQAREARLREALSELTELMEGVYTGDYHPDSFTNQPAREALSLPHDDTALKEYLAKAQQEEKHNV